MSDFVLDASIALSWCFADEATPLTVTLLEKLESSTAFVPSLWTLEIGNVLLCAEKKKRISYAEIIEFIEILNSLKISIDYVANQYRLSEIFKLAHSVNLTTYDAAYLELALRLGKPLATKDKQLINAAKELGVHIIKK